MIILSVQNIEKSFGATNILRDASFVLHEGQHMALVGPNGAGKTTLFRLIVGELSADGGKIHRVRDTHIGYLPQQVLVSSGTTLLEETQSVFAPIYAMEKQLRALENTLVAVHDDALQYQSALQEYDALLSQYEAANGYQCDSLAQGVLIGLGFTTHQFSQMVSTLSGGQQTRLALAKLLLQKPDLLLLDEPTNHLDLQALAWLEDYLQSYRGALLMVSHDRYFLDKVCDSVAELAGGTITCYSGNYTRYMAQRQALMTAHEKAYSLQQKKIVREEAIIQRYRSFNREKSIKAAESREKRLSKIDRLEKQTSQQSIHFSLQTKHNSGHDVLIAQDLSKSFSDKPLFSHLHIHLRKGDRVALLGPNGIGKSTLLKILCGRLSPDTGFVRQGASVNVGYFDQQQAELSPQNTILQELRDAHPHMTDGALRNALALFLFRGDDVQKPISVLSGGEKSRLVLLSFMLQENNLLMLDEPTNHLDMLSKEILENALCDFDGTLFTITHDRYFVNRVADQIWWLDENGLTAYIGNYDDFLIARQKEKVLQDAPVIEKTKTAQTKDRKTEREKRELVKSLRASIMQLEKDIDILEEKIAVLETKMSTPGAFSSYEASHTAAKEYAQFSDELATLMRDWEQAMVLFEQTKQAQNP